MTIPIPDPEKSGIVTPLVHMQGQKKVSTEVAVASVRTVLTLKGQDRGSGVKRRKRVKGVFTFASSSTFCSDVSVFFRYARHSDQNARITRCITMIVGTALERLTVRVTLKYGNGTIY